VLIRFDRFSKYKSLMFCTTGVYSAHVPR